MPQSAITPPEAQDPAETYRGLRYPWGREPGPAPGEPLEVAPGVWWVRFSMPIALDHINLWLLEDDDGWTVVDTCIDFPGARECWEQLFRGFMQGRPVRRVICTHMHPDHIGLAGWLTRTFDCALWMTRDEFLMGRILAADTGRPAPETALGFYHAAGYNAEQLENYRKRFGFFGRAIAPLPESFVRLVDRQTLSIGGRYWQVIVGSGHSPEHACLFCPALKLLISGDQVLPRITSNVSLFPTEPEGDPLREWLESGARLRSDLPEDLLVLPSHETPFYGLHTRLGQLLEGHERDLAALFHFLDTPKRAVDCFPALFQRDIDDRSLGLAVGETLAHLSCLRHRRQVRRWADEAGVHWFRNIPEAGELREK